MVWPYEGVYIGIGNVFNPSQTPGRARIGQVNMVLGWSADGRSWKWLSPDTSFVPLGQAGAFDSCGVFGAKQDPLRVANGKLSQREGQSNILRLYYAGCNGPFFGSRGCALGLATLQRDGWAGMQGGIVRVAPARVSGPILRVTVSGGSGAGVRVGITGVDGMGIDDADPIKGIATDKQVTWHGKPGSLDKFLDGSVQLIFEIPDDAIAFAYSFTES